jgi:uncharacterized Fe-S radical SAM superfamily protein PflX
MTSEPKRFNQQELNDLIRHVFLPKELLDCKHEIFETATSEFAALPNAE